MYKRESPPTAPAASSSSPKKDLTPIYTDATDSRQRSTTDKNISIIDD
jgi:hypothetical protein